MNELTVGMNRRTWTAVMDLMGLLGSNVSPSDDESGLLIVLKKNYFI